jgi:hypothetical protein
MGTWDTGPFDNDSAADFAGDLDEAAPEAREALIRGVLLRARDATGLLWEAEAAVAAAALIAAQCPGGTPLDPIYGPASPMPAFSPDLRLLAEEALARVAAAGDGPASGWFAPRKSRAWRSHIHGLRSILAPPPHNQEPLLPLDA